MRDNEWYTEFAQAFTMEQWGRALDIPIVVKKSRSNANGFFRFYPSEARRGAVDIVLNASRIAGHEDAVEVLKHELCHWYCYTAGMHFSDGEPDFERTLMEVGAMSTMSGYGDMARSRFIQKSIVSGDIKGGSITGTTFKTIESPKFLRMMADMNHPLYDRYMRGQRRPETVESAYEMSYDGRFVCHVYKFRNRWLVLEGMPVAHDADEEAKYRQCRRTRRDVALTMLFEEVGVHK